MKMTTGTFYLLFVFSWLCQSRMATAWQTPNDCPLRQITICYPGEEPPEDDPEPGPRTGPQPTGPTQPHGPQNGSSSSTASADETCDTFLVPDPLCAPPPPPEKTGTGTRVTPQPEPNAPTDSSETADPTPPVLGTPPYGSGPKKYRKFDKDPVATANGQFQRQEKLLRLPGRGLDLELTLTYDPIWNSWEDFGRYWDFNLNQRLVVKKHPAGSIQWVKYYPGNQSYIVFVPGIEAGVLVSTNGYFLKLRAGEPGSDCSFVIRDAQGTEHRFGGGVDYGNWQTAWLNSIHDRNGNSIQIHRYPSMRIQNVIDSLGKTTSFEYFSFADLDAGLVGGQNIGKLKSITDPSGRFWSFNYDSRGDLREIHFPETEVFDPAISENSVTAPFQTTLLSPNTRFEYDNYHFMLRVFESSDAPAPSLQNFYGTNPFDPLNYGRILRQIDANGREWVSFYWDLTPGQFHPLLPDRAKMEVITVQPDGRPIRYTFNGWGLPLIERRYEDIVDTNSIPRNQPFEMVCANWSLASKTQYRYDRDGNLLTITHPEENIDRYFYDSSSLDRFAHANLQMQVEEAGPRGGAGGGVVERIQTWSYEPFFNQLTNYIDNAERSTRWFYDYQEAPTITESLATMASQWHLGIADSLEINLGDLNGDEVVSRSAGDLVLLHRPDTHQADLRVRGNPTITQENISIRFQTNEFGQFTQIQDPEGSITQAVYGETGNDLGRLQSLIKDVGETNARWDFSYDLLGSLIEQSDPRGVISRFNYTQSGQRSRMQRAAAIDSNKNSNANLVPIPDYEESFYYDLAENLVRTEKKKLERDGRSHWVVNSYRYDSMLNLLEHEEQVSLDPLRSRKTRYEYDGLDRLKKIFSPLANEANPGSENSFNTRTIYYNALGLPCQKVLAEGSAAPAITTLIYDGNGNLKTVYDSTANGIGNNDSLTGCGGFPALGEKWEAIYDGFDRPTQILGPQGERYLTGYDAASNRIWETMEGLRDGVGSEFALLFSMRFHFDELNRLIRQETDYFEVGGATLHDDGDGDGIVQSLFLYDRNSRLIASENDNGNKRFFDFDGMGRIYELRDITGNKATIQYDTVGNPIRFSREEISTRNGAHSRFEQISQFNALNYWTSSVDSAGRTNRQSPDYEGRALFETDANENVTGYLHDDLGRNIQIDRYLYEGGLGNGTVPPNRFEKIVSTKTDFDSNDRVIERIDPNRNRTQYLYDALNHLRVLTNADGKTQTFNYDSDGNLTEFTQEDGTRLRMDYNAQNLPVALATEFFAATTAPIHQAFRYDALGRMSFAAQTSTNVHSGPYTIELLRHFDSLGNLRNENTSRNGAHDGVVQSLFDGTGNRRELRDANNRSLRFDYDESGRMRQLFQEEKGLANYDYVGSRVEQRRLQTSTQRELTLSVFYDEAFQPNTLINSKDDHQLITGSHSRYDRVGNRISEVFLEQGLRGDVFQFDSLYRLTQFQHDLPNAENPSHRSKPKDLVQYSYDDAGNRSSMKKSSESFHYRNNQVNEIESINRNPLHYDERGNLLDRRKENSSIKYRYDSLNRLNTIDYENKQVEFQRDALGRIQVENEFSKEGKLLRQTLVKHDQARRIAEKTSFTDGSQRIRRFVYGVDLDELLIVEDSQFGNLYPLTGPLGSTTALVDENGTVLERYRYPDGFGKPTFLNPDGLEIHASAYGFDRLFTGARYEAIGEIYDLRNRFYDPKLGRFLNRDPMGIWFDNGNLGNGYGYVGNNPLNFVDPFGLEKQRNTETFLQAFYEFYPELEGDMFGTIRKLRKQGRDPHGGAPVPKGLRLPSTQIAGTKFNYECFECMHFEGGGSDPAIYFYSGAIVREAEMARERLRDVAKYAPFVGPIIALNGPNVTAEERDQAAVDLVTSFIPFGKIFGGIKGIGGKIIGKTLQVSSGPRSVEKALSLAERWLGPRYKELAPGVFRSEDGLRQFRMTTSDIEHKAFGPHVHFETFVNGVKDPVKNIHVPITE